MSIAELDPYYAAREGRYYCPSCGFAELDAYYAAREGRYYCPSCGFAELDAYYAAQEGRYYCPSCGFAELDAYYAAQEGPYYCASCAAGLSNRLSVLLTPCSPPCWGQCPCGMAVSQGIENPLAGTNLPRAPRVRVRRLAGGVADRICVECDPRLSPNLGEATPARAGPISPLNLPGLFDGEEPTLEVSRGPSWTR